MTSSVEPACIDMATYDTVERELYGTETSVDMLFGSAHRFAGRIQKTPWFSRITQTHVVDTRTYPRVSIGRSGDWFYDAHVEFDLPSVTSLQYPIRWQKHVLHNLLQSVTLQTNTVVSSDPASSPLVTLTPFSLDAMCAFTQPPVYFKNIGNVSELTNASLSKPARTLSMRLPFFNSATDAIPVAAIPFAAPTIDFQLTDWTRLLLVEDPSGLRYATPDDVTSVPDLTRLKVHIDFAVVSGEERRCMSIVPFTKSLTNYQQRISTDTSPAQLDFTGAVKCLLFMQRDVGTMELSTYNSLTGNIQLIYDDAVRSDASAHYYTVIQPSLQARMHAHASDKYGMYSYALDAMSNQPTGSTNFTRLVNTHLKISNGGSTDQDCPVETIVIAMSHTVLYMHSGALALVG